MGPLYADISVIGSRKDGQNSTLKPMHKIMISKYILNF